MRKLLVTTFIRRRSTPRFAQGSGADMTCDNDARASAFQYVATALRQFDECADLFRRRGACHRCATTGDIA
jgi:hypothetical protein